MTEQILTWVDEVQPTIEKHGDWSNPDERVAFYGPDLTSVAKIALGNLADQQFDAGTCQANGCTQPIGYTQSGEADEILTWHWTTVVYKGREILLVCEDCSPTTVYQPAEAPSLVEA